MNIGRALCVCVPLVLWFAPLDIDARTKHVLAIASFMILAWITEALDYALAGFIGCYLFWALGVVPFGVAFSGFATDTPWFLFGAALFGAMATKTGLARRIAFVVMQRVGKTYARILLGLIITDFLLTFIIPSGIARVVVMSAVALGLVEAFGVGPGSNIGRAMFLIITLLRRHLRQDDHRRSGLDHRARRDRTRGRRGGPVEPVVLRVPAVRHHHHSHRVAPDAVALSAGKELVHARRDGVLENEIRQMGGWNAASTRAALLIALAIGLWLTDFLHHISPSIIGLGVGLAAVLPGIGVLDVEDMKRMNYLPVFFVAAAVSMGEVLVQTKTLDLLTNLLLSWMEPLLGSLLQSTLVLYWTALRVSHLPGERDLDAGDIHPGPDEFCQEPRHGPAARRR